ncbi:MAG TPA: glycosyltransferase family 9 protein [Rudaea sp.]|jgi:ADP-heptose:LPS heptosyltransferase|uniref:glycosyltransferase family 9 protein n=1 Tax=Rudaea sp. TaxID=2136325 RepID=UPI002F94EFD8
MDIQLLRRRLAQRGMQLVAGDGRSASAQMQALPASGVFRVLICRLSHSLGNTLLMTPLIQEIEATWPGVEIDLVTRSPAAAEIFAGYDCVQNIFCMPRHGVRHPLRFLHLLRSMRDAHYDLAIDTDPRSQSGRALLLRSRARYKLGFVSDSKGGTLSHAIDPQAAPKHAGQFPVYLLRAALRRPASEYPPLDLRLTHAEHEQGGQILARLTAQIPGAGAKKGIIGIFANATGPKFLDEAWWRDFMPAIETHFADFAIVEIVPMSGESMLGNRYPAYYSTSIRKLAKVLSQLSILICLDCGIMHLARASGTRTAAIFTSTETAEWGPYGAGAYTIRGEHQTGEQVAHRLIAEVPAGAFHTAPT